MFFQFKKVGMYIFKNILRLNPKMALTLATLMLMSGAIFFCSQKKEKKTFTNVEAPEEQDPFDDPPPSPVSGLAATPSAGRVKLIWFNPSDEDLSEVKMTYESSDVPETGEDERGDMQPGAMMEHTIGGLRNDVSYQFNVWTVDEAGQESEPKAVVATPKDLEPPGEVTLQAVPGDRKITLSWTNPEADDIGYLKLEAAKEDNDPNTPAGTLETVIARAVAGTGSEQDIQEIIDSNLNNDVEYKVTVEICDTQPKPNCSVSTTTATPEDNTAPGAVTGLAIVGSQSPSGDSILLAWTNPGNADFDHVEITWSPNTPAQPVEIDSGGNYTVTGLTTNTNYAFTVTAVDDDNNRSPGVIQNATPTVAVDSTPTASVSGVSASGSDNEITLRWTNPSDSDFFRVRIKRSGVADVTTDNANIDSHTVTGLTNGDSYSFTIIALDSSLNPSGGVNVTAAPDDNTGPADVQNVVVSTRGHGQVRLTWSNPLDSDFCFVEIIEAPNHISEYLTTETNDYNFPCNTGISVYDISGLRNSVAYTFTIEAYGDDYYSSNGVEASITTLPPTPVTGVTAISDDSQITLSWINPTTDPLFDRVKITWADNPTGVTTSNSSRIITHLNNGATYDFTITAVDSHNKESSGVRISATPVEDTSIKLTYYGDPFVGTGHSILTRKGGTQAGQFDVRGHPGAAWPFGMTQLTPLNAVTDGRFSVVTDQGTKYWVYWAGRRQYIKAFGTNFITGPGCQIGQDFPFMAVIGDRTNFLKDEVVGSTSQRQKYTIAQPYGGNNGTNPSTTKVYKNNVNYEHAEPGYYRVTYYEGSDTTKRVTAEFTVTPRTGVGRFTFPNSAATATVYLSTFHALVKQGTNTLAPLSGQTNAVGMTLGGRSFCGEIHVYNMHAAILFDRPYTFTAETGNAQARLTFALGANKVINFKVGRSAIGQNKAYENIEAENSTDNNTLNWAFSTFKDAAKAKWNELFRSAAVEDGPRNHRLEEKRIFYSLLYQTHLHPNTFSDHDGQYRGFDNKIRDVDNIVVGQDSNGDNITQKTQYQNFSGWDTYRGQAQLVAFFNKQVGSDMAQSLVNNAKEAGCTQDDGNSVQGDNCTGTHAKGVFTRWGYGNDDTQVMNGEPGAVIVGGSYAFGGRNIQLLETYNAMIRAGVGSILSKDSGLNCNANNSLPDWTESLSVSTGRSVNQALRAADTPMRKYYITNSCVRAFDATTLDPGNSNADTTNHVSNFHEFAAADFAKAQFVKAIYEKAKAANDTANMALYGNKYKELMNYTGDTWRKAYIQYPKQGGGTAWDLMLKPGNGVSTRGRYSYNAPTGDYASFASFAASGRLEAKYREGEAHHYRFMVPFDVNGLFAMLGMPNQSAADAVQAAEQAVNADPANSDKIAARDAANTNLALTQAFINAETAWIDGIRNTAANLAALETAYTTAAANLANSGNNHIVENTDILERIHDHLHGSSSTYNTGEHGFTYNLGNQPGYSTPWALNYTGLPHYTQFSVRKIHNEMFDDQPNYAMAGNDDLGSLSAQYVWSALGLYPAHAGAGILHLTSPRFRKVIIRNEKGRTLMVMQANADTAGVDSKNFNHEYIFIKDMTMTNSTQTDVPYTKTYIRYNKDIESSISGGGLRLNFTLTKHDSVTLGTVSGNDDSLVPDRLNANKYNLIKNMRLNWGRKASDLPPSGSGGVWNAVGYAYPAHTRSYEYKFGDFFLDHQNY